ncbi:hypothetical protein ACFS5M_13180 [Lacinutrix iliipiscaria]|uniref:Uncharacterized protein n=1 Tax=Lacinutrix iliipiscaria TaxID=1230532 RepID=A0ABW5WPF5_9FLAO
MNVTINIKNTEPKVNIVKDREAEEKLIQEIASKVVNDLSNNPEVSEKVKKIGKEKLRDIAVEALRDSIKKSEEKQIVEAKEMSAEISSALIAGIVKTTIDFANEL